MEGYDNDDNPLIQGIISGSAAMTGVGDLSRSSRHISEKIQNAMSFAVLDASKEGITDPNEIRSRMLAARKRVIESI